MTYAITGLDPTEFAPYFLQPDDALAMRGYDAAGSLHTARLAMPGQADETIGAMLDDSQIACIAAHNAAHGCFAARVTRHEEQGA